MSGEDAEHAVAMLGSIADDRRALARLITLVENDAALADAVAAALEKEPAEALVVGITGPPGAGKSTLVGRLAEQCLAEGTTPAVLAVDPSSPITGGATLGDRVRMASGAAAPRFFIRSIASRGHPGGLAAVVPVAIGIVAAAGAGVVIVETVGVGQGEVAVAGFVDVTVLVTGPATGDEVQAAKAGLLEVADVVVVNKDDLAGAAVTLRGLKTMLHVYAANPPEVLSVSATEGRGIDTLLAAIRAATRKTDGARLDRRREAVAVAVAEAVRTAIAAGRVGLDGTVDEAAAGRGSVTTVIDQVLRRLT